MPEKSHTGSYFFCPLKVRGCSIRSAKAGTRCLFKWEALQSNKKPGLASADQGSCLPGPLCTDPPRHVFHWLAQKSASTVMRHKLFDNNMTQLIRTRLQNVCLWGPANSAMCLRGRRKRLKRLALTLGLGGGCLYVHKRCTPNGTLWTKGFS